MSFLYSQSLVALLSALKVQSKSLSYAGEHCKTGDNYLRIDCSSTKTSLNDSSQCDARADKSSKGELKVKNILEIDLISLSSAKEQRKQSREYRGTQREYSSKPLKHSIVKRILVFKR